MPSSSTTPNPADSPEASATIRLPERLQRRLEAFRRQVWYRKMVEGALAALLGLLLGYFLSFGLDRFFDTPPWLRAVLLVGGAAGLGFWLPVIWHRWIWQTRALDQVARLVGKSNPRLGDQLLGTVELARHHSGSPALIEAAFRQVDERLAREDLSRIEVAARGGMWGAVAGAFLMVLIAGGWVLAPEAARNALGRWVTPWQPQERYTFADLEEAPRRIVVPRGEPFEVSVKLEETSLWKPGSARAGFADRIAVESGRDAEGRYRFEMQPRSEQAALKIRAGDDRERIEIVPTPRPELLELEARVQLPDYLRYEEEMRVGLRNGVLNLLQGGLATLEGTTNRPLREAFMDGERLDIEGASMRSVPMPIEGDSTHELTWRDRDGLEPKSPLRLQIVGQHDAAPEVSAKIPGGINVMLLSEVLQIEVEVRDDFGIRETGLMWEGAIAKGSKLVAAGDPEQRQLSAAATFAPRREGIEAQTVRLFAYALDYLPDREPARSQTFVIHILSDEEHMLWLADRMNQWLRRAEEVYDLEKRLLATNRELQDLPEEKLDDPEIRQRIEDQAKAERDNAERLRSLTGEGRELAQQATRNAEFDAEDLEAFVEMLAKLTGIARDRMPEVADLLKKAAEAPKSGGKASEGAAGTPGEAGEQGEPGEENESGEDEVAQQEPGEGGEGAGEKPPGDEGDSSWLEKPEGQKPGSSPPGGAPGGQMGLPTTNLASQKPPGEGNDSAKDQTRQAVVEQTGLLREFESLADEMRELLAGLHASSFVKRLKAASRAQIDIAAALNDDYLQGFGVPGAIDTEAAPDGIKTLAAREELQSQHMQTLQSDLEGYFHRKQDNRYKALLDKMRESGVVGELRDLSDAIRGQLHGRSIVAAEFWADSMDRWAEELVPEPEGEGAGGGEGGGGDSEGLPPSLVLEVMKILREQIDLRAETRELEQARPVMQPREYRERAGGLRDTQADLRNRSYAVAKRIEGIPLGAQNFEREIKLLTDVAKIMGETVQLLSEPSTGPPVVAAETEAIELLLQSQRSPGSGGGGGGGAPPPAGEGLGGQGSGLGGLARQLGLNGEDEGRDVDMATGREGRELPEEFRNGLDRYFKELEGDGNG